MPFTYDIDPDRCLVTLTAEGVAEVSEWFEIVDSIVVDARYRPGFDFLYDRTQVRHVPDTMYVRAWVFRHAEMMKRAGNGRLAVVVKEPVIYGMMRMASAFADGADVEVDVFWSKEAALQWLGRDSGSSVA